MADSTPGSRVPPVSPWLLRGFKWYVRRFVRRNFHAVRLLNSSSDALAGLPSDRPVLVYMNHPSWWDPMLGVVVATQLLGDRQHFGAIDQRALEQYRVFAKIGFFGVDTESGRGGVRFLRTAEAILRGGRRHAVWVTAQGAFTDVRDRPVTLRPGVAAVVDRLGVIGGESGSVVVLPLAVELVFWNERYPEALLAWGEPITVNGLYAAGTDQAEATSAAVSSKETRQDRIARINAHLERRLEHAMEALADAARSRDPARFIRLGDDADDGRAGVGGLYDLGRRITCWMKGKPFSPAHRMR